jgi:hypothetical protein
MVASKIPVPAGPNRTARSEEQRQSFEQEIKARTAATENRKLLWQALNQFISRNGGYLTSPPHAKPLLVEVPQYSELPDKLADLGYQLAAGSNTTRIIGGKFVPVTCYNLTIPLRK